MTRVLSALVLISIVLGVVCLLPAYATTVLAMVAAILAGFELRDLRAGFRLTKPMTIGLTIGLLWAAMAAAVVTVRSTSQAGIWIVLMAMAAAGPRDRRGWRDRPSWSDWAVVAVGGWYVGLPLMLLARIRVAGPAHLLWLLGVIVVSDSAQYYTGRAFGRHLLAPTISPKKTVEGAVGGLVIATGAGVWLARWGWPEVTTGVLVCATPAIVIAGMLGDLFESYLKRRAGVKDSSALIPGHGGVLDRLDSWLFAAPVYYLFLR